MRRYGDTLTRTLHNPAKTLADLLTLSRVFIALAIVGVGYFAGEAGLETAIRLTLLGWITDLLDGRFARKSGTKNWVSDLDFPIDMAMLYAMFVYFALSGFVSFQFVLWYTVVALGFILLLRKQAVTKLFATPLYLLQILIAYSRARRLAYVYLLYIVVVLFVNWERFKHEVEVFIREMREVAGIKV